MSDYQSGTKYIHVNAYIQNNDDLERVFPNKEAAKLGKKKKTPIS